MINERVSLARMLSERIRTELRASIAAVRAQQRDERFTDDASRIADLASRAADSVLERVDVELAELVSRDQLVRLARADIDADGYK